MLVRREVDDVEERREDEKRDQCTDASFRDRSVMDLTMSAFEELCIAEKAQVRTKAHELQACSCKFALCEEKLIYKLLPVTLLLNNVHPAAQLRLFFDQEEDACNDHCI